MQVLLYNKNCMHTTQVISDLTTIRSVFKDTPATMGCSWSSIFPKPSNNSYNSSTNDSTAPCPNLSATEKPLQSVLSNNPASNDKKNIQLAATNTTKPSKKKKKKKNRIDTNKQNESSGQTSSSSSNGGLSPVYDKLPPKAKKCKVLSVYDGDTLTIYNKKRIRLIGIDTPELKNPTQAFSQEAKEYTRSRCEKQTIWLSYEPNKGETEDRFGRLVAWVWVLRGDGKYECVNEGLLQTGLATVYTLSRDIKLHNIEKLISMQKEARLVHRGMWGKWLDYIVVKPIHGTAFHHRDGKCEHLKRSKNIVQVKASDAMDEGRHACRTCLAEDEGQQLPVSLGVGKVTLRASVY